ncbi:MAG: ferritin family protein [Candidatus Electryonea clarkiae]|nr:ferritin family protein [Candidatus Electryonea clarkiae]MDP8289050.1 ferritin family protein [Candidatus Electryonea clarkiae]
MNVFDFAMKMEKDGEEYYRNLIAQTDDKGLKTILGILADEEVKHYNVFKAMNEHQAEWSESSLMISAVNVFEEYKNQGEESLAKYGDEAAAVYKTAQEVEKKSEEIYRKKAEEIDDEEQIKMLHRIADEEKRHWNILQNIIEMIERPGSWLENAEWRHQEEH